MKMRIIKKKIKNWKRSQLKNQRKKKSNQMMQMTRTKRNRKRNL